MSDPTKLDNNEITDLLFKSYLGFPSTSESNAFYDEPNAIKYNNYVIGSDVMVDPIPTGANLSWSAITLDDLYSEFDISLNATDFSNAVGADDVEIDVSRAVVRFNHLRIDNINSQPTDAFYKLDGNGNNVLKDSIQYNYNKYTDGDGAIQQPYIYSLYDSDKSKLVPSNGNWLFDVKFGVVTFYDFNDGIPSSKNVDKDVGIYLTFCKYVGRKGVSNISSTADLTGGQDASFGEVEVSGNLTVNGDITSNYITIIGKNNTSGYPDLTIGAETGGLVHFKTLNPVNPIYFEPQIIARNGLKQHSSENFVIKNNYDSVLFTITPSGGVMTTGSGNTAYGVGSLINGETSTANGAYSHIEGIGSNSTVDGDYSHAEGYYTTVNASYSHSEGRNARTHGDYSHAEGYGTNAYGSASHVEGLETVAYDDYMHAQGRYNVNSSSEYSSDVNMVVGTGNSSNRRDGMVVLSDSTVLINPSNNSSCGIGTKTPDTNYALDVSGNINVGGIVDSQYLTVGNTTYYSQFLEQTGNSHNTTTKLLKIKINRLTDGSYNGMFNLRLSLDKPYQMTQGMGTTTIDIQGYFAETYANGFSQFNYSPVKYGDGVDISYITYYITKLSDPDGPLDDNYAYIFIKLNNFNFYYSTLRAEHTTPNHSTHGQNPFMDFISFELMTDDAYSELSVTPSPLTLKTNVLHGNIMGNAGTVTNGVYTDTDQIITGTKTFNNIIYGDLSGNAATVTNGVYTTGNQTIAGTKTFSNSIIGNLTGNVSGTVTDTNPIIIPTTNSTNIYLKQNGNYASFYASSGTNIRDLLMSFYAVDDNTTSTANTDTTQIAGYLYRKWKFFNLSGEGSSSIVYANTLRGVEVEGTNITGNSMFSEQYLINTNGDDWKIENNTGGSATYDYDLHFLYGSGIKGSIRSSASNSWANYMNFTGQHHNYSPNEDISVIYKGFIVSSSGTYKNFFESGNTKSKNNITINDSLPIVVLSSKQQDKACFGVISDKDDESDTIRQSSGNFVSVFQVKNEDRRLTINSLGEGAMWVCDANGAIENGDYITTSVIPGIGMKQDEVFLANYTVAKITMDCDFAPQLVHQNKLKLDASGNPEFNETTRQYEYELRYDDSGNPVMEEEYDHKYLVVNGDGYVVYNDEARTDVFLQHEHDFATLQPDIIGNTYKMAFVGCTYHCG